MQKQGFSRYPPQSRNRRRQRSDRRPATLSRRRSSASKRRGWHVQLFTSLAMISAIKDLVAASPVPVRVRSFRRRAGSAWGRPTGLSRDLVELVKSGKAYVKISGGYRTSKLGPDFCRCSPRSPQALIAANADRIVWGTDWPHPDSVTAGGQEGHRRHTPLFQIDDGRLLKPASGVGAGCRDPQEDPGRQSDAALRVHLTLINRF